MERKQAMEAEKKAKGMEAKLPKPFPPGMKEVRLLNEEGMVVETTRPCEWCGIYPASSLDGLICQVCRGYYDFQMG